MTHEICYSEAVSLSEKNPGYALFSRPEKLPLKIQTDSSGTFYSNWVEKALLFANWSSFSPNLLEVLKFLKQKPGTYSYLSIANDANSHAQAATAKQQTWLTTAFTYYILRKLFKIILRNIMHQLAKPLSFHASCLRTHPIQN